MPAAGEVTTDKPARPVAIFMFLAFFACGAAALAAATGVLPATPGATESPRWVVGCVAAVFMAGAFVPLNATFGLPAWVNQLVTLTVGVGLALVFNWIAFFPGERHFTGGISVPGVQLGGHTGALSGRIVFGLGALLCDAFVLMSVWRQLRSWRTGGAQG